MPPHTARDTVHFLRTNNIDFIDDWPANSPDLNPIEHVWDSLDRRLRRRPNPSANINELHEWNNIPQAEINTLVNYMCQLSIQEVVIPVMCGLFLSPTTLAKKISKILLTYGHDLYTKQ